MNDACRMHVLCEKCGKSPLGEPGLEGETILKCVFKNMDVKMFS